MRCEMENPFKRPERFKNLWTMKRKQIDNPLLDTILTGEEISKIIIKAEAKVGNGIEALQKNYDESRRELRTLAQYRTAIE